MKKLSVLFLMSLVVTGSAQAANIYCMAKYFSGNGVDSVFTATVVSATELKDAKLTVAKKVVFVKPLLQEVGYSSRSYPDYIRVEGPNSYEDSKIYIAKILLPNHFITQKTFTAIIVEQASDGGAYNRFFCYNNQ